MPDDKKQPKLKPAMVTPQTRAKIQGALDADRTAPTGDDPVARAEAPSDVSKMTPAMHRAASAVSSLLPAPPPIQH